MTVFDKQGALGPVPLCVTHKAWPWARKWLFFPVAHQHLGSSWEILKTFHCLFHWVAGDHSKPLPFIAICPLSQVQLLLGGGLARLPTSAACPPSPGTKPLSYHRRLNCLRDYLRRKEQMRCVPIRTSVQNPRSELASFHPGSLLEPQPGGPLAWQRPWRGC